MNMLDDFYTLNSLQPTTENDYICELTLNAAHPIFKGHFPDKPITPGVCMLQILKNIVESITAHKLFLYKTVNVKFMALINPYENPELTLTLSILPYADGYQVKSTTSFGDTVALKLTNYYNKV